MARLESFDEPHFDQLDEELLTLTPPKPEPRQVFFDYTESFNVLASFPDVTPRFTVLAAKSINGK